MFPDGKTLPFTVIIKNSIIENLLNWLDDRSSIFNSIQSVHSTGFKYNVKKLLNLRLEFKEGIKEGLRRICIGTSYLGVKILKYGFNFDTMTCNKKILHCYNHILPYQSI